MTPLDLSGFVAVQDRCKKSAAGLAKLDRQLAKVEEKIKKRPKKKHLQTNRQDILKIRTVAADMLLLFQMEAWLHRLRAAREGVDLPPTVEAEGEGFAAMSEKELETEIAALDMKTDQTIHSQDVFWK